MTISKVTNEQLRERMEIYAREQIEGETPEKREIAGFYAAAFTELLAAREAQSVPIAFTHYSEISNMQATGLYLRAWPADRRLNKSEGYTIPLYTAPPTPASESDHLKRAINLAEEARELAERIRAEETLPSAPAAPVSFDALADAVKEVTGGIRMEFSAETFKGHQAVPFMNFNSLSRIVEMFRTNQ